jgi:GAF domain-containing protein
MTSRNTNSGFRKSANSRGRGQPRGSNPRAAQTAFPAVAAPWPDLDLFTDPLDYVRLANQVERHWIIHTRVCPTRGATESRWPQLSSKEFSALVDRLGLAGRGRPNLRLEAREFLHGLVQQPGQFSDWAPSLPNYLVGRSYELAVAVAIVAACAGRPLASDLLFTGAFGPGSLELKPIDRLDRKLTLALGCGGDGDAIPRLTEHLYEAPDTTEPQLGPQENRVLPGRVRLLIASCEVSSVLQAQDNGFEVEPLPRLTVAEVSRWSRWDRRRQADGGLILAAVTRLADVLALAGLPDSTARERFGRCPEPCFFRVRPRPAGERGRRFWEDRLAILTEVFADRAEQSADRSQGVAERKEELGTVLDLLRYELNRQLGETARCFAADVAMVGDRPGWLDVVAQWGTSDIPIRYPATLGITSRVLASEIPQPVPDTGRDEDFQQALAPSSPAASEYPGEEGFSRYVAFLRQVRACIKFPVKGPDKSVAAVTALHVDRPCPFAPDLVGTLARIASLAEPAVSWLRCQYEAAGVGAAPLKEFTWDPRDYRTGPLQQSTLRELGRQLVLWARQHVPGVYRSSLRIVSPDRNNLLLIAKSGYTRDLPEEYEPLTADTTAAHAATEGRCVWLEDTGRPYHEIDGRRERIRHKPLDPAAGAHAAVLLGVAGHVLGVLSLDWPQPQALPQRLRRAIEDAVAQAAQVLKSFLVDTEFNSIDRLLRQPHTDLAPVFSRFLEAIARLAGGRYAMLFLREPETGRYRPRASLGHSPAWQNDREVQEGFAPGQGLVGWIAQHRRPVRLSDHRDKAQLDAIHPADPPRWEHLPWFDREFGDARLAYLGVPILSGGEVLGVVRLANTSAEFRFEPYEEHIVASAAARLGDFLLQQDLSRRTATSWIRLIGETPASSLRQQADYYLGLLPECVGPCEAGIRICDHMALPDGTTQPALRRLACTEGLRYRDPPLFRTRDDAGLSVQVWQTGQELIAKDARETSFLARIGAERESLVAERSQRYPTVAGLPLRGEHGTMFGTIYVARRKTDAFTDTEIRLIRTAAHLIGKELAHRDEDEHRAVRLEIQQTMMALVSKGTRRAVPPGFLSELCRQLLDQVCRYLGAQTGTILISKSGSPESYVRLDGGIHAADATEVRRQLHGERFRTVSLPERDPALLPLFCGLDAEPAVAQRQRAILTLGDPEGPLVLFGVAAPLGEALSLLRVKRVQDILSDLWPMLQWLNVWGKWS